MSENTNEKSDDLIVIPDSVDLPSDLKGSLWGMSMNGPTAPVQFREKWVDAGLNTDWLMNPIDPATALGRAMRKVVGKVSGGSILFKTLIGNRGKKSSKAKNVAYQLAYDNDGPFNLDGATVFGRLEADTGEIKVTVEGNGNAKVRPILESVANEVRSNYLNEVDQWSTTDIRSLLDFCARKLDGVKLLAGNNWFLPPGQATETFMVIAKVVCSLGHNVEKVDTAKTSEMIPGIIASLMAEAEEHTKETRTKIEELRSGDRVRGVDRTMEIQESRLQEIKAKVNKFESLFEVPMVSIHSYLQKLRLELAEAVFTAKRVIESGPEVTTGPMLELDDNNVKHDNSFVPDDPEDSQQNRFKNLEM